MTVPASPPAQKRADQSGSRRCASDIEAGSRRKWRVLGLTYSWPASSNDKLSNIRRLQKSIRKLFVSDDGASTTPIETILVTSIALSTVDVRGLGEVQALGEALNDMAADLVRRAIDDHLTGLPNRRAIHQELDDPRNREVERSVGVVPLYCSDGRRRVERFLR